MKAYMMLECTRRPNLRIYIYYRADDSSLITTARANLNYPTIEYTSHNRNIHLSHPAHHNPSSPSLAPFSRPPFISHPITSSTTLEELKMMGSLQCTRTSRSALEVEAYIDNIDTLVYQYMYPILSIVNLLSRGRESLAYLHSYRRASWCSLLDLVCVSPVTASFPAVRIEQSGARDSHGLPSPAEIERLEYSLFQFP